MIEATAYSDDRLYEVDFDATPWFDSADGNAILRLAACGWRGDYPADQVVYDTIDYGIGEASDKLKEMMGYVARKKDMGFECEVDKQQALDWLQSNRPRLAISIEDRQAKGSW